MPLHATTPLCAAPSEQSIAEHALSTLARCRYVTRASFLEAMGPQGLRNELIDDWIKAGLMFQGTVHLDPLVLVDAPYLALTSRGARALAAATGVHVEGRSTTQLKRPSQTRSHDVCTGELALAVLTLAKDDLIDLVGVETDDRKLAFNVVIAEPDQAPEHMTLRPDAMVAAKSAMGTIAFLIETDRGTVQSTTMRRRYRGYLAWAKSGGPSRDFSVKALRVLTVAPTEARMKALMVVAMEANHQKPSGFLLFARQDHLTVNTAEWWLGPVAHALGTTPEGRVKLLPEREWVRPAPD
jgi:hypothetical protein